MLTRLEVPNSKRAQAFSQLVMFFGRPCPYMHTSWTAPPPRLQEAPCLGLRYRLPTKLRRNKGIWRYKLSALAPRPGLTYRLPTELRRHKGVKVPTQHNTDMQQRQHSLLTIPTNPERIVAPFHLTRPPERAGMVYCNRSIFILRSEGLRGSLSFTSLPLFPAPGPIPIHALALPTHLTDLRKLRNTRLHL